jgi:hypothetical protein
MSTLERSFEAKINLKKFETRFYKTSELVLLLKIYLTLPSPSPRPVFATEVRGLWNPTCLRNRGDESFRPIGCCRKFWKLDVRLSRYSTMAYF